MLLWLIWNLNLWQTSVHPYEVIILKDVTKLKWPDAEVTAVKRGRIVFGHLDDVVSRPERSDELWRTPDPRSFLTSFVPIVQVDWWSNEFNPSIHNLKSHVFPSAAWSLILKWATSWWKEAFYCLQWIFKVSSTKLEQTFLLGIELCMYLCLRYLPPLQYDGTFLLVITWH